MSRGVGSMRMMESHEGKETKRRRGGGQREVEETRETPSDTHDSYTTSRPDGLKEFIPPLRRLWRRVPHSSSHKHLESYQQTTSPRLPLL